MTETNVKTGRLICLGSYPSGLNGPTIYHQCVDCKTDYPEFTEDQAREHRRRYGAGIYCNGQNISFCPYCCPGDYLNPNRELVSKDDRDFVKRACERRDQNRITAKQNWFEKAWGVVKNMFKRQGKDKR